MTLHTQGLQTLAQVRDFVSGNEPISFSLEDRHTAYDWMADTLRQFGYARCKRSEKGILRRYLRKVTGLSRAQVARCIKQFTTDGGRIKARRHRPAVPFVRRYTVEDIRLLAEMDALHGTLSGTTTRKLCERARGAWRCTLRAAGGYFGIAPVQPARETRVNPTQNNDAPWFIPTHAETHFFHLADIPARRSKIYRDTSHLKRELGGTLVTSGLLKSVILSFGGRCTLDTVSMSCGWQATTSVLPISEGWRLP